MSYRLFRRLFLACVFAASALAAQAPARYDEALKLYQAGKYEDSLAVIRAVFDSNAGSVELRTLAAMNYVNLGQLEPAIAHSRYCAESNPTRFECRAARATALRRAGRYGDAVAAAEAGLRATGENIALRLEAASASYAAGRYDAARRHVEKVIAQDQNNFPALYLDGLIFLRQGNFENAEFRLRNALTARPRVRRDLANAYINLGFAIENQADALQRAGKAAEAVGRYREALEFYDFALETDASSSLARQNRERVQGKAG